MTPSRAVLLPFLALGFSWSTAIPLGRFAGDAGVPSLIFPLAQAVGAVLLLSLVRLFQRLDFGWPLPWGLFLVSGLLGHALPQVISFITIQHLPTALVGLVIAMNPIFTGIVASVTGTQALSRSKAVGIALGFLAVALVSLPGATLPGWDALPWIAFGMLTPLCFAFANTYSARLRPKNGDPGRDAIGMMGVSAVFLFAAALLAGQSYNYAPWTADAGSISLTVHGVIAALAFALFFVVLERGGPIMVASASYLILILSGIWGWLFFGEVPTVMFIVASVLVVIGLTLVLGLWPRQPRNA